jgi:hypothetical protein
MKADDYVYQYKHNNRDGTYQFKGLTVRDHVAIEAMNGSMTEYFNGIKEITAESFSSGAMLNKAMRKQKEVFAERCFSLADAMIAESQK